VKAAFALTLRKAEVLTAVSWAVSWLFLYREIYVWQHVTPSLHLNPPPPRPGLPPPQPGLFVIAVLVASPAAPIVFVMLAVVDFLRRRNPAPKTAG